MLKKFGGCANSCFVIMICNPLEDSKRTMNPKKILSYFLEKETFLVLINIPNEINVHKQISGFPQKKNTKKEKISNFLKESFRKKEKKFSLE